jgi:hypothetical protein
MESLGRFQLTGSQAVICDPFLDIDDAEVTVVDGIGTGNWDAFQVGSIGDRTIEIYAIHEAYYTRQEELEWKPLLESLISDGAIVGFFDKSHFHDETLVSAGQSWSYDGKPAAPHDLWYSMIVETILGRRVAAPIPFGLCVKWDRSIAVRLARLSNDANGVWGVHFHLRE